MKPSFSDVAIIFYLVISTKNTIKLLSLQEAWASGMAAAVVVTCLVAGYALSARLQEAQRIERIIRTEVAQRAIAVLAQNPGFDQPQAEKTVRALCASTTEDDAKVLLVAIACMVRNNNVSE